MKSIVQAVKNAELRAKRYRRWDALTQGFGLAVNVDGSKTSILIIYAFEGHQRCLTIGKHGSRWTPRLRAEALRMSAHARSGTDPEQTARERKAARTSAARVGASRSPMSP